MIKPATTRNNRTITSRNIDRQTRPRTQHNAFARIGATARWALAVAACLWLAWCTAVGPLYWNDSSIANFGALNALFGILAFAIYLFIVVVLVRKAHHQPALGWAADRATGERTPRTLIPRSWRTAWRKRAATFRITKTGIWLQRISACCGRWIVRCTDKRWKIALVLVIGWLWVPTTLLAAFGADLRSQAREFSWAWNQWTGLKQPYIGFFSFAPMDIYPTAHYLWPDSPTYLTDQHNILLTLWYGSTLAVSRYFTGSNDWGIVLLAAIQWLFAIGCIAATLHRFLNLPWLARNEYVDFAHPERGGRFAPTRLGRPERGMRATLPSQSAHAPARIITILFFLLCPLAVFSTISLTKSPLFAFAFTWAFGIWYELYATSGDRHAPAHGAPFLARFHRLPARTFLAFLSANAIMLISAKYAWYVLLFEFVLALIADRRHWKVYVFALLVPTVLIHGGISMAINSGIIISGDPIESHGVQLQQIARIANKAPETIPESARRKLAPVFNLDQMAEAYFQQDADPVKSSGIQSKKVSYRWRSVTPESMKHFNEAWLETVRANPVVAVDALMAKCFGYFDIADLPYVSMDYYVYNDQVTSNSTWIKYYNANWRAWVANTSRQISRTPVLGWPLHGNFYVILTLLIGAAEVILRRWRTLAWHLPLLLLMGVMITAPANNFERHMLPIAFCFVFLCLTFWRDSHARVSTANTSARACTTKD